MGLVCLAFNCGCLNRFFLVAFGLAFGTSELCILDLELCWLCLDLNSVHLHVSFGRVDLFFWMSGFVGWIVCRTFAASGFVFWV